MATSPTMVKGAFRIGKTALLSYLFHYSWTTLSVPAFLIDLDDIIIKAKEYLIKNSFLEKIPNKDLNTIVEDILSEQIKSFISGSEKFNYIYGEYDFYISLSDFIISLVELNQLEYSRSILDKIEEQLIRRVSVFSNIDQDEQVYYIEGITSDINQYSRLISQIEIYDVELHNDYDKNLKEMLSKMVE